jgi:hypothetical protein
MVKIRHGHAITGKKTKTDWLARLKKTDIAMWDDCKKEIVAVIEAAVMLRDKCGDAGIDSYDVFDDALAALKKKVYDE